MKKIKLVNQSATNFSLKDGVKFNINDIKDFDEDDARMLLRYPKIVSIESVKIAKDTDKKLKANLAPKAKAEVIEEVTEEQKK